MERPFSAVNAHGPIEPPPHPPLPPSGGFRSLLPPPPPPPPGPGPPGPPADPVFTYEQLYVLSGAELARFLNGLSQARFEFWLDHHGR
ncbi:unnamed protein product [Alternaria alternata]